MRATRAAHDIPRALTIVPTKGGECKFILHYVNFPVVRQSSQPYL